MFFIIISRPREL